MKGRPLHLLGIGDAFHAGSRDCSAWESSVKWLVLQQLRCQSPNCTGPRIANYSEVGTAVQAGSFISVKYRGETMEDVSCHVRNSL